MRAKIPSVRPEVWWRKMKSQLIINERWTDEYWSTPLTGVVCIGDAVERIAVLPYMLVLDSHEWAIHVVGQSLKQSRRAERYGQEALASRCHNFAVQVAELSLRRGPGPADIPLTLRSQYEPRSVWEDDLGTYVTKVLLPNAYPPLGNPTFLFDLGRRLLIADRGLHPLALRFSGDAVLPVAMSCEELTTRLTQVGGN